jgi:hypothetical protein
MILQKFVLEFYFIFENFNISENNIISIGAAKVVSWVYLSMEWMEVQGLV